MLSIQRQLSQAAAALSKHDLITAATRDLPLRRGVREAG